MKKFGFFIIALVSCCFTIITTIPKGVVCAQAVSNLQTFEQSNVLAVPTGDELVSGLEMISTTVTGLTAESENQYSLLKSTSNITITASINATPQPDIGNGFMWHLKTPNSASYVKVFEGDGTKENNGSTYTFEPSTIVSSENGFGAYKLFVSAKTSASVITSKVLCFNVDAGNLDENTSKYTISKQTINNSKAEVEAFTFSLNNAKEDWLDYTKIVWFVNGTKIAVGKSFAYEPETTESFRLEVKYQTGNLISIASINVKPNSTGTLKLVLVIAGVVVVLSAIFAITLKSLNKKRDVVW